MRGHDNLTTKRPNLNNFKNFIHLQGNVDQALDMIEGF